MEPQDNEPLEVFGGNAEDTTPQESPPSSPSGNVEPNPTWRWEMIRQYIEGNRDLEPEETMSSLARAIREERDQLLEAQALQRANDQATLGRWVSNNPIYLDEYGNVRNVTDIDNPPPPRESGFQSFREAWERGIRGNTNVFFDPDPNLPNPPRPTDNIDRWRRYDNVNPLQMMTEGTDSQPIQPNPEGGVLQQIQAQNYPYRPLTQERIEEIMDDLARTREQDRRDRHYPNWFDVDYFNAEHTTTPNRDRNASEISYLQSRGIQWRRSGRIVYSEPTPPPTYGEFTVSLGTDPVPERVNPLTPEAQQYQDELDAILNEQQNTVQNNITNSVMDEEEEEDDDSWGDDNDSSDYDDDDDVPAFISNESDMGTVDEDRIKLFDMLTDHYGTEFFQVEESKYDNLINYKVTIHYPEITVTNTPGQEHIIRDFFIKFSIYYCIKHGTDKGEKWSLNEIEGIRTTYTKAEIDCNYVFSHCPSGCKSWREFCLGERYNSEICRVVRGLEDYGSKGLMAFEMMFTLWDAYLQWESLEGGPYMHMGDVREKDHDDRWSEYVYFTDDFLRALEEPLPITWDGIYKRFHIEENSPALKAQIQKYHDKTIIERENGEVHEGEEAFKFNGKTIRWKTIYPSRQRCEVPQGFTNNVAKRITLFLQTATTTKLSRQGRDNVVPEPVGKDSLLALDGRKKRVVRDFILEGD